MTNVVLLMAPMLSLAVATAGAGVAMVAAAVSMCCVVCVWLGRGRGSACVQRGGVWGGWVAVAAGRGWCDGGMEGGGGYVWRSWPRG